MAFILTLFLLIATSLAHAYELIVIQAVSTTKRTFITRNGKRQGVTPGITGTFTAEDVSVLAKAIHVTGQFTQWELVNQEAVLPFEKGAVVTYYPAQEYIWALSPENERKKYIKSYLVHRKRSFILNGALTRGLAASVSDAPANETSRGGAMAEIYYEQDFYENFSFNFGFRYEREVINYPASSFTTERNLFMGGVLYYFDVLQDYIPGRFYLGPEFGYGLSKTESVGFAQSGPVTLLPAIRFGLSLPFDESWDFMLETAFESLQTREAQEDGTPQTTTQSNFKSAIGLRKYF